ncbi:MAG: hypothetical protein PHX25_03050 [Candidatus Pacebacteria bacterium]|nr:hypothetical protein [Candidatus Paceibacterota bacterium]
MSTLKILDSKGRAIKKEMIVGMADPVGNWSMYQGLVIESNSDITGDEYCVAVYFDKEVPSCHLWNHDERCINQYEWDKKYGEECPEILLISDIWKKCYRIWFFRPEELVVEDNWKIKHLCDRLFKNMYHSWYDIGSLVPENSPCSIKSCLDRATKLTLCNVWGTVYPLFTCCDCFFKYNGRMADDLPDCKKLEK